MKLNFGAYEDVEWLLDSNKAISLIKKDSAPTITLAQVFWLKNNKPEKLFVVSAKDLSVKKDFSDFGTDISQLRKRLRKKEATEIFDTFSDYSNKFRQFFGIRQPEALDLFCQTVSMKSVGNLTEFVREHMLGKTDVNEKIQDLVKRYEELTDAYNSVKKARLQLELLKPLIENLNKHDQLVREVQHLQ